MSHLPPVRGVCFDLWNTLAFTDASPHPIVALAEAFGLRNDPDWRRTIERAMMTRRIAGISEAIDALARETGRGPRDASARGDLVLTWGRAANRNRLYPDALPAIAALRRRGGPSLRVGILSNTQSFDLDFIRRDGLEAAVDAIFLSCDTGLLKPDPRFYEHAACRMGIPAGRMLMVGDSPIDDVEGAGRAGWRAIRLDRTAVSAAAGVVRSLLEVPVVIPSGA